MLRTKLERLSRGSTFTLLSSVDLRFDAFHPQGLCRHDGVNWLATADVAGERGYLIAFDDDGELLQQIELTDGPRFHPGGIDVRDGAIVVPVSENQPRSSTLVVRVDATDPTPTALFRFDDHLGAVGELPSGELIAGTWGSRHLLRLAADGTVLDRRRNPTHFVDVQDVQVVDGSTVFCSGVLTVVVNEQWIELGGVVLLDVDTLALRLEVPVATTTRTGRPITYNPVRVAMAGDALQLAAVPDDGRSQLLTYAVG